MEDEDGDLVCENCGHVIEPEGGEEEEDEDDATEQEARSAPAEEKEVSFVFVKTTYCEQLQQ